MFNTNVAIAMLLGIFAILIISRFPVTFALAVSTGVTMLYCHVPLLTLVQQMATAVNKYTLMSIPFFILAGEIMGAGGVSDRLLETANAFVGHLRGGLAHVNVVASMMFGHMSGSAVADVSSLGTLEIPMMTNAGYDKDFAIALTVSSSCQGIIIPPSQNLIIYSLAAGGVSIGALFMGGLLPGILMGILQMIVCYVLAVKRNYPKGEKIPYKARLKTVLYALPALFTVIIILVGTSAGLYTATDSAAIACVWALFISIFYYKKLSIRQLPKLLRNVLLNLAMCLGLLATAGAFGWMMAYLHVPAIVTEALIGISNNKFVIMLLINIMLLLLGCILDMAPLILICTPILLPVVQQFGMNPVQFGVMMIYNLAIGLCTPPVGSALFVGCSVGKMSIEKVTKALLPLYAAMVAGLILVTFIPAISSWLPHLLGYVF